MADAPLGFVTHPAPVETHVLRQASRAFPRHLGRWPARTRLSGLTGGRPAKRGGISIMALLMSTATGLRSLAWASRPRR